jgi:hypothetical protein
MKFRSEHRHSIGYGAHKGGGLVDFLWSLELHLES